MAMSERPQRPDPPRSSAEKASAGGRAPVVEAVGLSKSYGPVRALDRVDLCLLPGEVRCVAGENGAGKSTLIRLLTGAEPRDQGTYAVDGKAIGHQPTPARLREAGVGAVYQELSLLPQLSVQDNLLMGRFPSVFGLVDRRGRSRLARERLARVGLADLPSESVVGDLPMATRQLVEIARVLGDEARLVVFDEPTTALSDSETAVLLGHVRTLSAQGIAVLYITHRIEEMFEVGDTVTVLRDGSHVTTRPISEFTPGSLVEAMVGRSVDALYPDPRSPGSTPRLEVRGLTAPAFPDPVDLTVNSGEIVGLAGLVGAGRTELLQAVFGADAVHGGAVLVDGTEVPGNSPRAAAAHGIGMLTEDRKESGLLPGLSIRENIAIASYTRGSRWGYLSPSWTRRHADAAIEGLGLRYRDLDDPASSLSGGNQQRMLLARWLALDARVLLLDEPTKGVDVGAKAEIYQLVAGLAERGMAVLVVSSYLPELLGLCDRITVMRGGRLTADLRAADTSEAEIARHASLDTAGTDGAGGTPERYASSPEGADGTGKPRSDEKERPHDH
ncbi:sugar ABC transporter ATP-binding protein [Nocardiopsis oceani]